MRLLILHHGEKKGMDKIAIFKYLKRYCSCVLNISSCLVRTGHEGIILNENRRDLDYLSMGRNLAERIVRWWKAT